MGDKRADVKNDDAVIKNAEVSVDERIEVAQALAALKKDGGNVGFNEGMGLFKMVCEIIDKRDGFALEEEDGFGEFNGMEDAKFVN